MKSDVTQKLTRFVEKQMKNVKPAEQYNLILTTTTKKKHRGEKIRYKHFLP